MTIKGIFFDFDGTLIPLTEAHFFALNQAIEDVVGKEFLISEDDHHKLYNGLSTRKKLQILSETQGLSKDKFDEINRLKQLYTLDFIENKISKNLELFNCLSRLKADGYILYCVSNAIFNSVKLGLEKLGIFDIFDKIITNENVIRQKPFPDIYLISFLSAELDPSECLIIEDSRYGCESAYRSGGFLCKVENDKDITYEYIISNANKYSILNKIPYIDQKLNILVPMSGNGQRYKDAGFKLPKPLIDVNGKPMIQRVVENINIDGNYIFIVQKAHYDEYNLGILLPLIAPNCKIVQTNGLTEGAACSTLLAKELINNDNHLIIANSDQLINYDSCDFMYSMISKNCDGGLLTFNANETKWSYAQTDEFGNVCRVAEKEVISDNASVGIYYYKRGKDYVRYAEQMISKNIRVKGEYYVCPVFNEFIQDNKVIKTYNVNKMIGLGTPEDYNLYINSI